jgi:phospholipase C
MLVMSPFSRGGHIASEVFDHTSQLKLVSERFGVALPNVSAWRRGVVGDLTSALFGGTPSASVPAWPSAPLGPLALTGSCNEVAQETEEGGISPAIPAIQVMPVQ